MSNDIYYYVDGYNLAFHTKSFVDSDFEKGRDALIASLSSYATTLRLNVAVVFDSYRPPGHRERSHFAALEVLYTAQGETADDLILSELSAKVEERTVVVVTSDKRLAWRARQLGAKTASITAFLSLLKKRWEKKSKAIPAKSSREKKIGQGTPTKAISSLARVSHSSSFSAASEEAFTYYLTVFASPDASDRGLAADQKLTEEVNMAAKSRCGKQEGKRMEKESEDNYSRWQRLFEEQCRNLEE